MGARADFYVQDDQDIFVEGWIGSIAWDGHPESIPAAVTEATTHDDFIRAVHAFGETRDDFSSFLDGWPWPWEDSRLTDFCYVFAGDAVATYCFGAPFVPGGDDETNDRAEKADIFPCMTGLANVQLSGKKSGLIVISVRNGQMVAE